MTRRSAILSALAGLFVRPTAVSAENQLFATLIDNARRYEEANKWKALGEEMRRAAYTSADMMNVLHTGMLTPNQVRAMEKLP